MVAVKKDFLSKKAGGARAAALAQAGVGSHGSMDEDSRSYFGFLFPVGSDHWEVHCLICEYIKDFLEEFTLEVLGVTNADGHICVCVEFFTVQTAPLEAKIFEKRDSFIFHGSHISAVKIENPELFKKPRDPGLASASGEHPAPAQAPAVAPPVRAPPSAPTSSLFSTPNRRLVHKVFETTEPPPGLPVTPALPQGSSEDKLDKVLTSLDALTTFIKSEVVTRNHLDKFHQEQLQILEKRIEQSVGPVHVELKELRARLVTLETQHIGLGSARARSFSERPRASDPAFKTIVFKNIPEALNGDQRIVAIESFMKSKFPQVRIRDIGNYYKGAFPNGRSLTRAAYVELSNADVRREVLDKIGPKDSPKIKCTIGGSDVAIKKALTEAAMQRNSALRRAADLIKGDARFTGKLSKIEWNGERGVTVDGSFVFKQAQADLTGTFDSKYPDLSLPVR